MVFLGNERRTITILQNVAVLKSYRRNNIDLEDFLVPSMRVLFVALPRFGFNVVKEVSLKSVKNKTWDLTSRTFRSNDADPTNGKLTNYSNS